MLARLEASTGAVGFGLVSSALVSSGTLAFTVLHSITHQRAAGCAQTSVAVTANRVHLQADARVDSLVITVRDRGPSSVASAVEFAAKHVGAIE